jgi:hypothetical protein
MPDCPRAPFWRPIIGKPSTEVTKAANLAIEEAYRTEKGDSRALFGSQFEEGFDERRIPREIRLPYDAPNKEFGDELLEQLRGPKGGPRKPDIVDFRDRAFYEIKPVRTFKNKKQETIRQHLSLYRNADSFVQEFNNKKREQTPVRSRTLPIEDPWVIGNAKWKPPSCLTLPGLKGVYKLDTFNTDYTTDPNCRGIIIYRVWKKVRRREEEEKQPVAVSVADLDRKYDKLIPDAAALRAAVGRYNVDEPEHIIIVPKHIDDRLGKQTLVDLSKSVQVGEKGNRFSQPSMFSKIKTTISNHAYLTAGAVIVVAASGVGLYLYLGVGVAAAAGAGAGEAAAEGAGAEIISLAARQALAEAAKEVAKKAASVLIVFGVVKSAKANEVSFSSVETMKLIPASSVSPYKSTYSALSNGMCIADAPESFYSSEGNVCVGDHVMYDSKPHSVVATMTAYPNNVCSDE